MDFLDPKKKRSYQIRLYIGYGLMAVALAFASIILAYATFGYGIDRSTGSVIQNGLINIETRPVAADIFVNGIRKGTSSNRLVLPAGQYNIKLSQRGYHDWQHDYSLEGSSIIQLNYPVLFPKKMVTKPITTYASLPGMASQSTDRRWLVVQTPGAVGRFELIDTAGDKQTITPLVLPADTMTNPSLTDGFEAVEWASDNVHLLLKRSYGEGASEFIVLNRENPAASINLNKLFTAQPFISATLRDKKFDQFYLHSAANGVLLTADSKTKLTTPLLPRVANYKSLEAATLLYAVPPPDGATTTEIRLWRGGKDYLIRSLPASTSKYLLELADFSGSLYLVAGSSADGRAYIYKNPMVDLSSQPARPPKPLRVAIVAGAAEVSFSPIFRILAVQGGSAFAVFDAETGRQYRYDTKLALATGQKAAWMDGQRLSLVSGGKVNVFDFDGTNPVSLSPSHPAFRPFFSRDYSAMFTLAPAVDAPEKTSLLRTELKVLPAGQ